MGLERIVQDINEGKCVSRINFEIKEVDYQLKDCKSCYGHDYKCDYYKNSQDLPMIKYIKSLIE